MSTLAPIRGSIAAKSAARRADGGRLRCTPADRKESLDATLLRIVKQQGIAAVTLANVCAVAACSTGTLGRYYKGAGNMRLAAVNALAAEGDSKPLRKVFADGFDPKTKGLKLPKGFKL